MKYNFKKIEKKWQKIWKKKKIYLTKNILNKKKFYVLDMFPYPSGYGLHVGHILGYTASDVYSRFKKSLGYNVLHPIGFDSFGLPTEQFAIKTGKSPHKITKLNIKKYSKQLLKLGFSYDWDRTIYTHKKEYFKWTQWIFLKLFNSWYDKDKEQAKDIKKLIKIFNKNGNLNVIAYSRFKKKFNSLQWKSFNFSEKERILQNYRLAFLSKSSVNWCPKLGSVLANEEIENKLSKIGGYPVFKKTMFQWSLRIKAYLKRLLKDLKLIKCTNKLKSIQKKWIGKTQGIKIVFFLYKDKKIINQKFEIFTTKPYLIFGISFFCLPFGSSLINKYTNKYTNLSLNNKNRIGIFSGLYAVNDLNKKKIPIYFSNFVKDKFNKKIIPCIPSVNFESLFLAKKFNLNIPIIIQKKNNQTICTNSNLLNGLDIKLANVLIVKYMLKKKIGFICIKYKINNAIFSRQRSWGEPIPIYFKNKIPIPISEKYLPLSFPKVKKKIKDFYFAWNKKKKKIVYTSLIDNKNLLKLENCTMPSWAASNFYFLRYMDPNNLYLLVDKKIENYWRNVDLYIGGIEHATGHLIYSRFIYKFLYDRGLVSSKEPFRRILNQGMILAKSAIIFKKKNKFFSYFLIKDNINKYQKIYIDIKLVKNNNEVNINKLRKWLPEFKRAKFIYENKTFFCYRFFEKMSKSKFNVINPDSICEEYGADTLRLYELFLGPLEKYKICNLRSIKGVNIFLNKFWNLFHYKKKFIIDESKSSDKEKRILNISISKIKKNLESHHFNIPISEFMILLNKLKEIKCNKREILEPFTILIGFYAPHISEEIWEKLGNKKSIFFANFPKINEKFLLKKDIIYPITLNGKLKFKLKTDLSLNTIKLLNRILCNNNFNFLLIKTLVLVKNKIINLVIY
ncbi:Leucine--tRNA ligase (Leu-tRNA) [Candidatus Karelsulcia muelleri]|uniref:class I tRNA ligase family protein n=1 Tax=Candidatus Karelsulcia muelleri TaxID=336810 RepID=UPI001FF4ACDB|nr:class I tRNA ligase family protein [Candidatus Karelsulcia muelleri]UOQ38171.1 Leucine--tRNA ligase (Leu-tRNA) [Candidatus Karelsulcia muelleri]